MGNMKRNGVCRLLTLASVLGFVFYFIFCSSSLAIQLEKGKRDDHILYKLKAGISQEEKGKVEKILKFYGAINQKVLKASEIFLDKLQDKKSKTEEEICQELIATGDVEFAEPDYLVPPQILPNDPGYNSQWFHPKVNSPGAWDTITGSASIIVAVCDSGIESTHVDLAENLLLPGFNSVDNTSNTEPIHSHGTKVAGCVGAIGNNNVGVVGMNWNVKILPIRITNRTDGWAYFSDMYEGIVWAADHSVKVVNLSYLAGSSYTIDSAGQYLRNKGGLLFVAAGNDGQDISATYPDFASFVLVGATTSTDTKASFSNYGKAIDIVAPGVNIYTTLPGNSYGSVSGTSFASPISAGLSALIYAVNPYFTPQQVESCIFSTTADLGEVGEDNVYGYGRIDADRAVTKAKNYTGNISPTAIISAVPTFGNVPLSVAFDGTASFDPDGSIISWLWDFGDGSSATGATATHVYTKDGNIVAKLTVTDDMGAMAITTVSLTVYPDPNIIAAPTGLKAEVAGRSVTLSWVDNSQNEEGFYVERALKIKGALQFQRVATTVANVSNYTDTLATSGTYKYRTLAFNTITGKVSDYSNEVQVRVR